MNIQLLIVWLSFGGADAIDCQLIFQTSSRAILRPYQLEYNNSVFADKFLFFLISDSSK